MNEVEKMYRNCNIKKYRLLDRDNKLKWVYPPFTAEKQIELIKWLGKNKNGFGLFDDGTEGLSCQCDFYWEWFRNDFYAEDFDNALAGLINSLWQDLTDADKAQIKEILE